MSSNLSLALEDIIKGTKKAGINSGKGRRVRGSRTTSVTPKSTDAGPRTSVRSRFPQRGFVSGDVPAGKWKHDKFFETYGGGKKRPSAGVFGRGLSGVSSAGGKSSSGIAARLARKAANTKQSGMVKMQISNLLSTVVTSDLEELFQDYNVYGVVVHYDEAGTHLGTADIFTDQQTASQILREFKGIAIDNREIKFCIVTESGTAAANGLGERVNILDRLHHVASNPIKRRSLQMKKRVSGGGIRKKVGAARAGAAGRKAASSAKAVSTLAAAKNKTAEELDMELDAYMQKK